VLRKTMIVLAMAAALTGGLTADALARGGGGVGHGGGGGHGGGFGGAHVGGGFGGARMGGGFGGARMGGGFGRGHFAGPVRAFARGSAGQHFAGMRRHFDRRFDHDRRRRFDHDRRFSRRFLFVPSWDYGIYDYACSYGYPYYNSYNCNLPAY